MSSTDSRRGGGRHYLLFDAQCGYCRLFKSAIALIDVRRNLTPVELGSSASRALLGSLKPDLVMKSFHLVDESANILSGAEAMPDLASSLCASEIFGRFLHSRRVTRLLGRLYLFVSRITSASRCSLGQGTGSPPHASAEPLRDL